MKGQITNIIQRILGIETLPTRKGNTSEKLVSITFDDGPDPFFTPAILDVLESADVKVTFFLVGKKAMKHPEIVKRIVIAGHEIGNHTYSHLHPYGISSFQARKDFHDGKSSIESLTSCPVIFFRPPHGAIRPCVLQEAQRCNQKTILWSISGRDWGTKTNFDKISNRVVDKIHRGGIILLHDAPSKTNRPSETLRALPSIIHHIKQRGYKIVRIDRLLAHEMPLVVDDEPGLVCREGERNEILTPDNDK